MDYTILCKLDGKTITSGWATCPDDKAAIERANWYFQRNAADAVFLHRGEPFLPLGEVITEFRR